MEKAFAPTRSVSVVYLQLATNDARRDDGKDGDDYPHRGDLVIAEPAEPERKDDHVRDVDQVLEDQRTRQHEKARRFAYSVTSSESIRNIGGAHHRQYN